MGVYFADSGIAGYLKAIWPVFVGCIFEVWPVFVGQLFGEGWPRQRYTGFPALEVYPRPAGLTFGDLKLSCFFFFFYIF